MCVKTSQVFLDILPFIPLLFHFYFFFKLSFHSFFILLFYFIHVMIYGRRCPYSVQNNNCDCNRARHLNKCKGNPVLSRAHADGPVCACPPCRSSSPTWPRSTASSTSWSSTSGLAGYTSRPRSRGSSGATRSSSWTCSSLSPSTSSCLWTPTRLACKHAVEISLVPPPSEYLLSF